MAPCLLVTKSSPPRGGGSEKTHERTPCAMRGVVMCRKSTKISALVSILVPFTLQQIQLFCTRKIKRFWPVLGTEFNGISKSRRSGIPPLCGQNFGALMPGGPMSTVRGIPDAICLYNGQKEQQPPLAASWPFD